MVKHTGSSDQRRGSDQRNAEGNNLEQDGSEPIHPAYVDNSYVYSHQYGPLFGAGPVPEGANMIMSLVCFLCRILNMALHPSLLQAAAQNEFERAGITDETQDPLRQQLRDFLRVNMPITTRRIDPGPYNVQLMPFGYPSEGEIQAKPCDTLHAPERGQARPEAGAGPIGRNPSHGHESSKAPKRQSAYQLYVSMAADMIRRVPECKIRAVTGLKTPPHGDGESQGAKEPSLIMLSSSLWSLLSDEQKSTFNESVRPVVDALHESALGGEKVIDKIDKVKAHIKNSLSEKQQLQILEMFIPGSKNLSALLEHSGEQSGSQQTGLAEKYDERVAHSDGDPGMSHRPDVCVPSSGEVPVQEKQTVRQEAPEGERKKLEEAAEEPSDDPNTHEKKKKKKLKGESKDQTAEAAPAEGHEKKKKKRSKGENPSTMVPGEATIGDGNEERKHKKRGNDGERPSDGKGKKRKHEKEKNENRDGVGVDP